MPDKKFICWYAYQGHETEGHLDLKEPISFLAEDAAEAMYKYQCYLNYQIKGEPYHKSLAEHRESGYPEGGWGFNVVQLADTEYVFNRQTFEEWYLKYKK